MTRLQEWVEEIKALYPIEKDRVSFVLAESSTGVLLGEFVHEIIPLILAGYTYVAWGGHDRLLLSSGEVGVTYTDVECFTSKPSGSYVTTEDGVEGIIYQAKIR